MSFLVLQTFHRGRVRLVALLFVFLMVCGCKCSVSPPHGVGGWTAVCDCGIS